MPSGRCTFVNLLAQGWDSESRTRGNHELSNSKTWGSISAAMPYTGGGWSDDVTCSNRPLLAFLPPLSRLALLAWTAILVPFQRLGKRFVGRTF
jgi:hypothetical protein